MGTTTTDERIVLQIMRLTEGVPQARAKLRRLAWAYFLGEPDGLNHEDHHFLLWSLLVQHGKEPSLAEQAIEAARDLTPAKRSALTHHAQLRYVYGTIEEILADGKVLIHDRIGNERLTALQPFRPSFLTPDMGLLGPLFRVNDDLYELTGDTLPLDDASGELDLVSDPVIAGLMLGIAHHQRTTEWISELDLSGWRRAYEQFAQVLKPWGQPASPSILKRRIMAAYDYEEIFMQEEFEWWNPGEAKLYMAFVERLWALSR